MASFIERLCTTVANADGGDAVQRDLLGRAIADTLAVSAAGFVEPVTRRTLAAYAGTASRTWSGEPCESEEAAILINGTAAHALDFDDVFLDSTTHPSVVILPAILSLDSPPDPDRLIAAFAAGIIAARAVAKRVGHGHYHKGWHATGTLGVFAAAAAAGRLRGLSHSALRSAFALAAAQSGGLKINFSTAAKPLHAGLAAAAGVRAVRLASVGLAGAPDIFADGGYADLYGTGDGEENPSDEAFDLRADRLSLKLYPCCYASHRLIEVALDARRALGAEGPWEGYTARLTVPAGTLAALRYDRPVSGLQAKFSARFTLAVALLGEIPALQHFEDAALARPDIASWMDRITIHEDQGQPSGGDIEFGTVLLEVVGPSGEPVGLFARQHIPGSPTERAGVGALQQKIQACLATYRRSSSSHFPVLGIPLGREVARWLGHSPNGSLRV
jgi:2-methylcitrate dehydratase PrpD